MIRSNRFDILRNGIQTRDHAFRRIRIIEDRIAGYDSDSTFIQSTTPLDRVETVRIRRRPVLVILKGGLEKRRIPLELPQTLIGRDESCDLIVSDSQVSRTHSKIIYSNSDRSDEAPVCLLLDAGSTNGTFVNAQRIGDDGILLSDGDRIRIGDTIFGYFLRDEADLAFDRELEEMILRDSLTGLLNKTGFMQTLEKEIDRVKRYFRDLSLLVLDIDHFKSINDTHGHLAGDEVIKLFVERLRKALRTPDLCARFGGDEFLALLPETGRKGAVAVGERLRRVLSEEPYPVTEATINLTASVGAATLDAASDSAQSFLDRADRALYRAKEGGRNQVVLSG